MYSKWPLKCGVLPRVLPSWANSSLPVYFDSWVSFVSEMLNSRRFAKGFKKSSRKMAAKELRPDDNVLKVKIFHLSCSPIKRKINLFNLFQYPVPMPSYISPIPFHLLPLFAIALSSLTLCDVCLPQRSTE